MEPNFNCSICKGVAQYYCMCLPEKMYICDLCIPTHLSKGGAHPFAPISAPLNSVIDVTVYNQKLQLAQKLSGVLELLSSKLASEYSQLYATWAQCYNEQVNELYSVYAQAYTDLDAVYQGINSAIETSKQEIALWGQARPVDFSNDTVSCFDALHLMQSESPVFLNVSEEMKRRVTLVLQDTKLVRQDYLKNVLTSWELQKCACSECQLLNVLTGRRTAISQVGTPFSEPVSGCWTCTFCGHQMNQEAKRFCERPICRKERVLLEATWKCLNCSEVNERISEECKKCHVRKGWTNYLEYKGVKLNPDKTMWTCAKCNQAVAISEMQCCFCDQVLPVDTGLQGEDRTPIAWRKLKAFFK